MRSNAAAPTVSETWGAMAASVWNTSTVTFTTRDGSTARMLAGNGVPSVIGISPPTSPGFPDANHLLDSVHQLRQLGLTLDHDRQGPGLALVAYVLPGDEVDVLHGASKVLQLFPSVEKSGIVASSSILNTTASQPFPPASPQPIAIC